MHKVATRQPLVAETFSVYGRILRNKVDFVETISLNSINDHCMYSDCGNTLKGINQFDSCNFFNNVANHPVFFNILYLMKKDFISLHVCKKVDQFGIFFQT